MVLHGDRKCTKPESIIVFEWLRNPMAAVGELSAEWTLANSSAQAYGSLNRTWLIPPLWKPFTRFPLIAHSIELLKPKDKVTFSNEIICFYNVFLFVCLFF